MGYGTRSRIDFLLEDGPTDQCYVEVKNVHLIRQPGLAEFPDCVTDRGARHLAELTILANKGIRSVLVYVVQRQDSERFSVAADLDPTYGKNAILAKKAGVEFYAYGCTVTPQEITLSQPLVVM